MSKTRIMIVEDDNLAIEIIKRELSFLGYEVAGIFHSGEEAICNARAVKPDLVLMDIVLEGELDGIEAAEQIREHNGIPVVFITAYGDDALFDRAKLTEPFGYLHKPVQTAQLHHSIEMALYKHRLDERLRESENWYRTIFETTGGATMVTGEDTTIVMVNREFETFTGFSRNEVEQRLSWTAFFRDPELKTMLGFHALRQSDPEKVPISYESTLYDRSGAPKNIYLHVRMIPGTTKCITSMIDITPRKQLETAITRAKREWERTFDTVPDLIMLLDRDNKVMRVNKSMAERVGVPPADLIGKCCSRIIHGTEEAIPECPNRLLKTDCQEHFVETFEPNLHGDFLVSVTPLCDEEGILVGSVHVARDITEKKRAEEQLKASLNEKEVLLREIHHRVKNNMQVISSLLSLQATYIADEQVKNVFMESRDRVKSMALIHEKIYSSVNLAKIDFGEYCRSLVAGISRSFHASAKRIRFDISGGEVYFGVDTAIPCGLILNELVSNSLKHAFPGESNGIVGISLETVAQGGICLVVSDNGIGFPEHINFRIARTLGLRLVNMLVGQLRGTIEKTDGPGTTFTITLRELRRK